MPIRLVALDLDGTLLNEDHAVGAASREAIAAARQKGLRFAIVTGRMYTSARPIAAELALDGMPVIAYNGAMVAEYPSGQVLVHEPVPYETSRQIAEYCTAHGLHLQCYVNDQVFVDTWNDAAALYEKISGLRPQAVGNLAMWLQEPCTKLLIYHPAEQMPPVLKGLQARFGGEVEIFTSYPFFVEIIKPGVSKGRALAALADKLGLARDEVAAFGDGYNDISMMEWAGTGVAMSQAPAKVKAVAEVITTAPVGEGVAEGLRILGLA